MNTAATIALITTSGFAVGDWWSAARRDRRVEYVCKPATMVALIVFAIALDPATGADDRRAWFVAALVFSLAGDVFLMLPRDAFIAGLSAFLVAHVCYIAGFWTDPPGVSAAIVATVVVIVAIAPIAHRILRALGDAPQLRAPVSLYMVVIAAMVASAIASGNVVAAGGAVLFAASDSLIAWDRFVVPVRGAGVIIMVTYHLGQALLTLSLLVAR
ncbi:MAG: lysoplasmalogenase [Acidimicrobiia bacterium]